MSIFMIKIMACVSMVLDHVKYAIPETTCFATKYLGRIAFPLFAFLAVEGYCHTSNLKKYYQRLIIFALISQIPFMLFRSLVGNWRMLNIMFTLLLGLMAITVFDKFGKKYYFSLPLIALIIYMGKLFGVDYSYYGVAAVFTLYVCRQQKLLRIVIFALLNFVYYYPRLTTYYSISNVISYLCATLPVVLILAYNGKLGPKTKYIYYIFYPAHMLILYLISTIL